MPLKDQIQKIPQAPGVYFFLDQKKRILYIGRATSLKKRLAQYFRKDIDLRIAEMVSQAVKINYQKTPTLLDAVVLEANEIKKNWPKYNIKDRDNRSFVYLVIPKIKFSRPLIVRERELIKYPAGQAWVFGPYQSYYLVRQVLKIIRPIFPYGLCKPLQGKPCFDYQLGLCPGGCIGKINARDYQRNISGIVSILSGKKASLIRRLKKESPQRAHWLQHFQDVSLLSQEKNLSAGFEKIEGYDISHLSGKETYGSMVVSEKGEGQPSQYRLFKIKTAPANDDLAALSEVLERRLKHSEWKYPDLIMIDGGRPQIIMVQKLFNRLNITIPFVGISKFKEDELVFPSDVKKELRELILTNKPILLKVRDEAHRFANRASRLKRNRWQGKIKR